MSDRKPVLIVVDDEPGMLGLIERAVEPTGYEVELHAHAGEALSRLAVMSADVALVDLRMPDIDGFDVLRTIREAQPRSARLRCHWADPPWDRTPGRSGC